MNGPASAVELVRLYVDPLKNAFSLSFLLCLGLGQLSTPPGLESWAPELMIMARARMQQTSSPSQPASPGQAAASPDTPSALPPPGYVIGADDVLSITFWRERDLSAEVVVRPDGKISLPLLNEIQAAGLTPEQLRQTVTEGANKYIENANATVVVKTINSRKAFITGLVTRPGPYPITAPTTVLQLIATAGGLLEFADSENVVVIRTENGRQTSFKFNYKDVSKQKNLQQNIELRPGDTVVVP